MSRINLELSDHIKNYRALSQSEFGHYLGGLIEADGYFGRDKVEIVLHGKDKSAAYELRSYLGYGNVYDVKNKRAVKFVVSNRAGIRHLLSLVNGKLVGSAKVDQLIKHNYESKFSISIEPPRHSVGLESHWLSGFLDGDGTLGIFIAPSKTHKHKESARLEIKFTQKDPTLLHKIANLFNVNRIYKSKKAIHYLNVTGLQRLNRFLIYLDRYQLRTQKYVQYIIFRRAYRYMIAKKHLAPGGLIKLRRFKMSLQNVYKLE